MAKTKRDKKEKNKDQERVAEYQPGFVDRILLMTPDQLSTYLNASKVTWSKRIGPEGDLYDKYK